VENGLELGRCRGEPPVVGVQPGLQFQPRAVLAAEPPGEDVRDLGMAPALPVLVLAVGGITPATGVERTCGALAARSRAGSR
jgi:hypothetical protein